MAWAYKNIKEWCPQSPRPLTSLPEISPAVYYLTIKSALNHIGDEGMRFLSSTSNLPRLELLSVCTSANIQGGIKSVGLALESFRIPS